MRQAQLPAILFRRRYACAFVVQLLTLAIALAAGEPAPDAGAQAYVYSTRQVETPLRRASSWSSFEQRFALLPDGRVAIFMSREGPGLAFFDPKTEKIAFKSHAPQNYPFNVALLDDEKALVLSSAVADVYDFKKDEYTRLTSRFPTGHIWYCGFCRLPDGRYFFSGSFDNYNASDVCCVYDSKTSTFTTVGTMTKPRARHSATWIGDNRILICGGHGKDYIKQTYDTMEIFDLGTGISTLLPATLKFSRAGHGAIRLNDGTVLFVGGECPANRHQPPSEVEVFDPKTQTVLVAGTLARPRRYGILAPLPSGRVAIFYGCDYTRLVEVYVPETRSIVFADQLTTEPRVLCDTQPLVMPDGRLLNVGTRSDNNDKEIVAYLEYFTEEKKPAVAPARAAGNTIPDEVAALLKGLGADDFTVRENASAKLATRVDEWRVWIEPLKNSPDAEVRVRVQKLLEAKPIGNQVSPWEVILRLRNGQFRRVTVADSRAAEFNSPRDPRVARILAEANGEKIDELVVRFPKSYSYVTQGRLFDLAGMTWVPRVKLGPPLSE